MRKHLRRAEIEPDVVLCSPSVRTRETLELVQLTSRTTAVWFDEELYAASGDELLARLRLVPDEVSSAMLIGHNPGLQELAVSLASAGAALARLQGKYPTGALATLSLTTTWRGLAPAGATLAAFVAPKQLR